MSIVGNSQLALKRRDAIAEGWYPLNCYVGDFLRHMYSKTGGYGMATCHAGPCLL